MSNNNPIGQFMALQKNAIGKRIYPHNDRYYLSNRGHVYDRTDKVWLQPILRNGSLVMRLRDVDNKGYYTSVLTMVAETFLSDGRRVKRVQVKDGNKFNTPLSNLIVTLAEKEDINYSLPYSEQLFDKAKVYDKPHISEAEMIMQHERRNGSSNPNFFNWLCKQENFYVP
jgi:hypothetical protein